MKSNRLLDDLDNEILTCLREDSRQTNKSLAERLTVTEVTIASRIRAMEDDGIMLVIAQLSFSAAGYHVLANVDLSVSGRPVSDVAAQLATIEQVAAVTINIGDPSISLLVMASDLCALRSRVIEDIAHVDGVRAIETMIYADIIKYRSDFALL
jgi:Lrp/AsnC family leucine-responsive transcriptional regulator